MYLTFSEFWCGSVVVSRGDIRIRKVRVQHCVAIFFLLHRNTLNNRSKIVATVYEKDNCFGGWIFKFVSRVLSQRMPGSRQRSMLLDIKRPTFIVYFYSHIIIFVSGHTTHKLTLLQFILIIFLFQTTLGQKMFCG